MGPFSLTSVDQVEMNHNQTKSRTRLLGTDPRT